MASVELFQGMYFSSVDKEDSLREKRQEMEAVVVGVRANGVIVFNTRYVFYCALVLLLLFRCVHY